MGLEEFTSNFTREEKEQFAQNCGTTWGYLIHVIKGRKQPSATLAIAIERESEGQVTCEEICPGTDWEYIRSTQVKETTAA